ncbi:hypothetical protein B0H13DRAFT_2318156 [Mycena leptocephala]|nr:hypothetical protein B0H13DRAFT_2318156 [Mycena leptocephala]
MPPVSPTKPHPHSVDLLRNRDPTVPLGPFDGKVSAFAQLGAQHFFITTNADYVPTLPSLETPHAQWTDRYCHLAFISRKEARRELDIMWWDPTAADFVVGSTVTRGLGRLKIGKFSQFLPPINKLVQQCTELRCTSPSLALPLFGELIQHILTLVEQLETLPTTFVKMVFAVTSLQRAFLELDALYYT